MPVCGPLPIIIHHREINMNQEQLTSIIRQLLLTVGGGLVTKGFLDDGTLQLVVGAVMAVGAAAWAIYTRRNNGLVASAAGVPGVSSITAEPHIASAVPSEKVIPEG